MVRPPTAVRVRPLRGAQQRGIGSCVVGVRNRVEVGDGDVKYTATSEGGAFSAGVVLRLAGSHLPPLENLVGHLRRFGLENIVDKGEDANDPQVEVAAHTAHVVGVAGVVPLLSVRRQAVIRDKVAPSLQPGCLCA